MTQPGGRRQARRALWVVSVAEMAGVGRHVLDVAATGIPGWDLAFLVPPGPLAEQLRALDQPVMSDGFGQGAGVMNSVRALRRAAAATRPDVIHSHLAWADLLVAALPTTAVRVSTEHGIAGQRLLYQPTAVHATLKETLHKARLRRTAALIAVSKATEATVRKRWGPPRTGLTSVIPNGVNRLGGASQRTERGLRFGYLGRLAPEKNIPVMLEAFELVHRDHPAATLEIAGFGTTEDAVRADVRQRPFRRAVRLSGEIPPHDFFSRVDVVVQLSEWENCSYTLLDALAWGKGIVATAVGGNPELLPAHCLVRGGDQKAAAACMCLQANTPGQTPRLPKHWPTVEDMAIRIGAVYESANALQWRQEPTA